jgi:Protein of unknown function (DUF3768)
MHQIAEPDRIRRIRELNDNFRQSFVGGMVVTTAAVAALDAQPKARVLDQIRTFDDWTDEDDPHREHDFCAFCVEGVRYFIKIDYYNRQMTAGSKDPSDPEQTLRVLTVMSADDY